MSSGPNTRMRLRGRVQTSSPSESTGVSQNHKAPARGSRKTPITGQAESLPKDNRKTPITGQAESLPKDVTSKRTAGVHKVSNMRTRRRGRMDDDKGDSTETEMTIVSEPQTEKQAETAGNAKGRGKRRGCQMTVPKIGIKHSVGSDTENAIVAKKEAEDTAGSQRITAGVPAKKPRETLRRGVGERTRASSRANSAGGKRLVTFKTESVESVPEPPGKSATVKRQTRRRQTKVEDVKKDDAGEKTGTTSGKTSRPKDTREVEEEEDALMNVKVEIVPLPDPVKSSAGQNGIRTEKFVGAHCSIMGGLSNAVTNAVSIGAKSFALFLRSQRQWQAKPLQEDVAAKFREACTEHGFHSHLILPHGSYLLNCGSPNPETLSKSRDSLVDELRRCEKLGLTLYNFHPGSTCGSCTVEECLDKIGESINMALEKTSGVTAVIENMSCQGNTVGGRFEELRGIIDRVQDKTRIGVCLDTCHAFAAGYDLAQESGYLQMMADFDEIVGFQYLKGVHVNDSKGKVGCHLDRHENIGKGEIGLAGFRRLMNDPRFDNIPLILETPPEFGYSKEIKMLNSLME